MWVADLPLMRRRCSSMHGCAPNEDLEQEFWRSGATDCQTTGVVTCVLQPPLQLIPLFWQQCAFSAHSDHPEPWQEYWVGVIRRAHSELERVIAGIALNNTKTTLVVSKSLTAHVDISDLHKWYPQVGLVLVRCPCHVGQRQTSRVAL